MRGGRSAFRCHRLLSGVLAVLVGALTLAFLPAQGAGAAVLARCPQPGEGFYATCLTWARYTYQRPAYSIPRFGGSTYVPPELIATYDLPTPAVASIGPGTFTLSAAPVPAPEIEWCDPGLTATCTPAAGGLVFYPTWPTRFSRSVYNTNGTEAVQVNPCLPGTTTCAYRLLLGTSATVPVDGYITWLLFLPDLRRTVGIGSFARISNELINSGGPAYNSFGQWAGEVAGLNAGVRADFTVVPDPGGKPGDYRFTSTSTTTDGGLSLTWDLGDNSDPMLNNGLFIHSYKKPGRYTVTLTAKDANNRSSTKTATVVVAPPKLLSSLSVVAGTSRVVPDDKITVELSLGASDDGLGTLSNVKLLDPGFGVAPDGSFEIVAGPNPVIPAPGELTLKPGEKVAFRYQLKAKVLGSATASAKATAKAEDGTDVTGEATLNLKVETDVLKVAIVPSKNDFDLVPDDEGKPKPETLDVKITIENTATIPVKDISTGKLQLKASDEQRPYEPFPAGVVDPNPDDKVALLAPGAKAEFTRKLKVTGDGAITLFMTILSDQGTTNAKSELRVGVKTLLQVEIGGEATRTVRAGGPVTFFGTFKNITNDRTVAITDAVKVAFREGNLLGGGYLARADGQWAADPFPPPLTGILKAGQSMPFQVRFVTDVPSAAAYNDSSSGDATWARGSISFGSTAYRAAVKEQNGDWVPLSTAAIGKYPQSVRVKGGAFGRFDVDIDTTEPSGAGFLDGVVPLAFGLGVQALEGAQRRAAGIVNAGGLAVNFVYDISLGSDRKTLDQAMKDAGILGAYEYMSEFVVWLPKADQAKLASDIADRLAQTSLGFAESVITVKRTPYGDKTAIRAAVDAQLEKIAGSWRRNDTAALIESMRPVGLTVGEAGTDFLLGEAVVEGITTFARGAEYYSKARTAFLESTALEDGAAAEMKKRLPSAASSTLAQSISKSKFPRLEEFFQARKKIPDALLGAGPLNDGGGLARGTINASRQWSRDNPGKVIVIKPNEAKVAALRDGGLAVGKQELIKPKSLPEFEIAVFGGRPADQNLIVIRNMNYTDAQVESLFAKARAKRPDLVGENDLALAKQIRDKRKKEWGLFDKEVVDDPSGIGRLKGYDRSEKIPYEFQGADNKLSVRANKHYRNFKIEEVKDPSIPEGSYFRVLEEDPNTGKLLPVTGDDDGVFIGSANGLGLTKEEAEGAYSSLSSAFNHPFSDSWNTTAKNKLEIFSPHYIGGNGYAEGEPLIMFLNGDAYAVKIDPNATRFEFGATDYQRGFIKWVGAPTTPQRIPVLPSFVKALETPLTFKALPALFMKGFLTGPNAVPKLTKPIIIRLDRTGPAPILRLSPTLKVQSYQGGTWVDNPGAGVPAADGSISMAPFTWVDRRTDAGASQVEIAAIDEADLGTASTGAPPAKTGVAARAGISATVSFAADAVATSAFQRADRVAFDLGGPNEETAIITRVDGAVVTLATPLVRDHAGGELIAFLEKDVAIPVPATTTTIPPDGSGVGLPAAPVVPGTAATVPPSSAPPTTAAPSVSPSATLITNPPRASVLGIEITNVAPAPPAPAPATVTGVAYTGLSSRVLAELALLLIVAGALIVAMARRRYDPDRLRPAGSESGPSLR